MTESIRNIRQLNDQKRNCQIYININLLKILFYTNRAA